MDLSQSLSQLRRDVSSQDGERKSGADTKHGGTPGRKNNISFSRFPTVLRNSTVMFEAQQSGIFQRPDPGAARVPEPGEVWNLTVMIKEAKGLAPMDSNGKSDPYIEFDVIDSHGRAAFRRKTPVVKKNLNPTWNMLYNKIPQKVIDDFYSLKFVCKDHDLFGNDDFMGVVTIKRKEIVERIYPSGYNPVNGGKVTLELPLEGRTDIEKKTVKGTLCIEVKHTAPPPSLLSLPKIGDDDGKMLESASIGEKGDTKLQLLGANVNEKKAWKSVEIIVVRAKNLLAADSGGTSDPYVDAYIIDDGVNKVVKQSTNTITKTLNPEWNFMLKMVHSKDLIGFREIRFDVFDRDIIGSNDFLGQCVVSAHQLMTAKPESKDEEGFIDLTLKLEKREESKDDGKIRGTLEVRIRAVQAELPCNTNLPSLSALTTGRTTGRGTGRTNPSSTFRGKSVSLSILVKSATNLLAMDSGGTSDPYATVALIDHNGKQLVKRSSNTIKKTLNPVWDWDVPRIPRSAMNEFEHIQLEIFDHDVIGTDDFIGQAVLHRATLAEKIIKRGAETGILESEPVILEIPLQQRVGKLSKFVPTGKVKIEVVLKDSATSRASSRSGISQRSMVALDWELDVCVVSAENLPAADSGGTSDPFVQIIYLDAADKPILTKKSGVVKKNLNPRWNFMVQNLDKNVIKNFKALRFEVFDHDVFGSNDFLGWTTITRAELLKSCTKNVYGCSVFNQKLKEKSEEKDVGSLQLKIRFMDKANAERTRERQPRQISIEIDSAENLAPLDGDTSDPYVTVEFLDPFGTTLFKTRTEVMKKSLNPTWRHDILGVPQSILNRFSCLRFEVWDHDVLSADDCMGHALLTASSIERATAVDEVEDSRAEAICAPFPPKTSSIRLENAKSTEFDEIERSMFKMTLKPRPGVKDVVSGTLLVRATCNDTHAIQLAKEVRANEEKKLRADMMKLEAKSKLRKAMSLAKNFGKQWKGKARMAAMRRQHEEQHKKAKKARRRIRRLSAPSTELRQLLRKEHTKIVRPSGDDFKEFKKRSKRDRVLYRMVERQWEARSPLSVHVGERKRSRSPGYFTEAPPRRWDGRALWRQQPGVCRLSRRGMLLFWEPLRPINATEKPIVVDLTEKKKKDRKKPRRIKGLTIKKGPFTFSEGSLVSIEPVVQEKIDASGNFISKIAPGVFDWLGQHLKFLDLHGNKILELPPGCFDELVNLETLYLHRNVIEALPEGIFDKLVNLKHLWLQRCHIKHLDQLVFRNLINLTHLNLQRNRIKKFRMGIFDSLTNLMNLFVFGNRNKYLTDGVLDELRVCKCYVSPRHQMVRVHPTCKVIPFPDEKLSQLPRSIKEKIWPRKTKYGADRFGPGGLINRSHSLRGGLGYSTGSPKHSEEDPNATNAMGSGYASAGSGDEKRGANSKGNKTSKGKKGSKKGKKKKKSRK